MYSEKYVEIDVFLGHGMPPITAHVYEMTSHERPAPLQ